MQLAFLLSRFVKTLRFLDTGSVSNTRYSRKINKRIIMLDIYITPLHRNIQLSITPGAHHPYIFFCGAAAQQESSPVHS